MVHAINPSTQEGGRGWQIPEFKASLFYISGQPELYKEIPSQTKPKPKPKTSKPKKN